MSCVKCGVPLKFDTKKRNPGGDGYLCVGCWNGFLDISEKAFLSKIKTVPYGICKFQELETVTINKEKFVASLCGLHIKDKGIPGLKSNIRRGFCEPDICPLFQTWKLMKDQGKSEELT
jgi:hypothetical protein